MYQRYYNVIERVNILGGELASVYTGGVPRALAVDYRYRKINPRLNYLSILHHTIGMAIFSGQMLPVTSSIELF